LTTISNKLTFLLTYLVASIFGVFVYWSTRLNLLIYRHEISRTALQWYFS